MPALPTLRQLSFLVALDEERHFGRAAQRAHVTQSTLSAGLKELEAALGVAVADRSPRSVAMTPLGRALAERARRLLADAQALADYAAANGDPLSGELRLGAAPTIGPYLYPRLLPALRARFPGMRPLLHEALSEALRADLAEGRLDAAFVGLPYDLGDVEARPLLRDGYWLACARTHPLANAVQVSVSDLVGRPLLMLAPGHCLQRHALSAHEGGGLIQDASCQATSLATLTAMVAHGVGVTLLPELAVQGGATDGHDLALIPVAGARPRTVALVWRRGSARGEAFAMLADACAEALTGRRPGGAPAPA